MGLWPPLRCSERKKDGRRRFGNGDVYWLVAHAGDEVDARLYARARVAKYEAAGARFGLDRPCLREHCLGPIDLYIHGERRSIGAARTHDERRDLGRNPRFPCVAVA
jgi:hypothetical protein